MSEQSSGQGKLPGVMETPRAGGAESATVTLVPASMVFRPPRMPGHLVFRRNQKLVYLSEIFQFLSGS